MENDKPFKTIEVVDSRTNQVCKVACMSCIRGHRTTSCGIPVCRTKIFWTVKRPGRPSNSCTCRFSSTGGCKCVVARAACPHKAKKGEKRSGECRCDELGRYCCLIEPHHWNALLSLQKPTVDFFPNRESLEEQQATADQASLLSPTVYSSLNSPSSAYSVLNSPALQGRMHSARSEYSSFQQPMSSSITPRFGMMGIGGPMGSQNHPPDALAWQGEAPTAPRDFNPLYGARQPEQSGKTFSPAAQSVSPGPAQQEHIYSPSQDMPLSHPFDGVSNVVGMAQISPVPFDLDKLRTEYFQHQFPNSICQNCGLSGCTCRNCPPVFQNFGTTSWAQCCGRKHARDVQPAPVPQKVPRRGDYDPVKERRSQPTHEHRLLSDAFVDAGTFQLSDGQVGGGLHSTALSQPTAPPEFPDFDLEPEFNPNLALPDGADPLDLGEFLMSDLDRSQQELTVGTIASHGTGSEQGVSGGDDGCCCGGR